MLNAAIEKHIFIDKRKNYLKLLSENINIEHLAKAMNSGDLGIEGGLSASDIFQPLVSGEFCSSNLADKNWILESMLFQKIHPNIDQEFAFSPHESIFIASSYLYYHAIFEAGHSEFGAIATAAIVKSSHAVDSSIIISAIEFIYNLNLITVDIDRRDCDPRIYYQMAIASLWSIIFDRISSDATLVTDLDPIDIPGVRSDRGAILWLEILNTYKAGRKSRNPR